MARITRRKILKDTGMLTGGAVSGLLLNGCSNNGAVLESGSASRDSADGQPPLRAYPVRHGGRKRLLHPELKREIHSQTAVCYLRFLRTARISYLELPPINDRDNAGRWVPSVPTHPAHVTVSVLDRDGNRWVPIKDVDLPPNPNFAGAGLSQDMPIEQMEVFFESAMARQQPHRIALDGVETDCLRVECDREHPVWPNHGECNGGPYNVPFGIFEPLRAFGTQVETPEPPAYRRKLKRGRFSPAAPDGMTLDTRNPLEVGFKSNKLAIGFSLIRPMLTHLEWDHFGGGTLNGNRLFFQISFDGLSGDALGGMNGPSYITSAGNFIPQNMTGTVEVVDNQVRYLDIETGCGVTVNAVFTVTAESIILELEQTAERDIPAMEAEAWRLLWNMRKGMTSVAGVPIEREGRNGFVHMPAIIAADEGGGLRVKLLEGQGAFHAESYRFWEARSTGFVLSALDTADAPAVIRKGTSRAVFEITPCALLPVPTEKEQTLSEGVRKYWTAGFSAFRPEFGGISNNAISTHTHMTQSDAADFLAFTAAPSDGPDPMEMAKFSVGRALLDGGGYGYHRDLYMDPDPVLVSCAGRIVQLSGDQDWLERVGPGIVAAAERILGNFDAKEGMIVCRDLSGNSGTYRWGCNRADVISFGHIDAYVNAWSYRALKNAASLFARLNHAALAARCRDTAAAIFDNYARQLINPETGWVSGWRSRDGRLHDYAFVWINGVAGAFGVMDVPAIRRALGNLEAKRKEVFPESGYLGLPWNLIPIAAEDHMLPQLGYDLRPTFENYTDGALSPALMGYYLRGLSTCGLKAEARAIIDPLERGFADGKFCGPYGTGKELMTWTGADSGYEGTCSSAFVLLYAIAVERGVLTPPDPEWWL